MERTGATNYVDYGPQNFRGFRAERALMSPKKSDRAATFSGAVAHF